MLQLELRVGTPLFAPRRDDVLVVRSAPHYDPRIAQLVVAYDDEAESMAETCRRVSAAAEALGITRPSLVHLRTFVREERERKRYERVRAKELRELAGDVAMEFAMGRVPNFYKVLDQIEEAGHPET